MRASPSLRHLRFHPPGRTHLDPPGSFPARARLGWAWVGVVVLTLLLTGAGVLLSLAFSALLATPAQAQLVMSLGVTEVQGTDFRVPRGPGLQARASWELTDYLRLSGSVAREWGESRTWRSVDEAEVLVARSAWATAQAGVELRAPVAGGVHLTAGGHLSHNVLEGPLPLPLVASPFPIIGPVEGRPDPRYEQLSARGRGWEVGAERHGLLGRPLHLRASLAESRVTIPGCPPADTFPCGDSVVRRVSLGVGVPLFE